MRISDWSSDVCSSDRLMAAHLSGQRVSVSSLCIAAAVPATTALRWIRALTDHGLFLRQADPSDGRRVFIALSDKAAEAMALFRSEEHTSELQSLMRTSYAVFCLKKKKLTTNEQIQETE